MQLLGGHYAILQFYAWGGMLASYSQEGGFTQGLKETFSGDRPCTLCCKISAAREQDEKNDREQFAPKLSSKLLQDFFMPDEGQLIPPFPKPAALVSFVRVVEQTGISAHAPPVPPPRRLS